MDEPLRLVAESALEEAQVVAEPISFEAFFDAEPERCSGACAR